MAWNRGSVGVCCMALCLLTGCGATDSIMDATMLEGAPLSPSRIQLRGPASRSDQPLDLFRAVDIGLVGEFLAIVDNGNDRIVLIDSALNVVWIRGGAGAGPGEFDAPFGVVESPAGLIAVDFGNGRFTELDRDGNLVRTLAAPSATRSFGVRSDGAIVAPGRRASHYAFVVRTDGQTPFAERPDGIDAANTLDATPRLARVAVTPGDTVHILDESLAELLKYDPEGRLVCRAALPRAVVDSVRETSQRRREAFARQGLRMTSRSTTKNMTLTADGRLLIAISAANTVGFLVDPHSYTAQRIVIPADQAEWAPLKNASSMVLLGDRLFVLQADSVFAYRLPGAS